MGVEDDLMKDTLKQQSQEGSSAKKIVDGKVELREIEGIGPKGEPSGKQVVEAHSGFHTNPQSEEILGKRKGSVQLNRGVIYDKDGHPMALGGSSGGDSHLKSS